MSTAAPKVSSKHTQKYRNLIALIKGKKRGLYSEEIQTKSNLETVYLKKKKKKHMKKDCLDTQQWLH